MLFKFAISNLLCIVLCNSITQTVEIWLHTETFFFWPCVKLRAALGHETYQEVFDAAVTHHYLCFNFFISLYFFKKK
jgi:hypothetical protein